MAAAAIAIAAREMIRATGPMCCSLPGAASAVAEVNGPRAEAPRLLEIQLHALVQRRVALDVLERAREHDLRRVLPDTRELELVLGRRRMLLLVGVPGGHHLVQAPPVQVHSQPARLLVVEAVELLVRHDRDLA